MASAPVNRTRGWRIGIQGKFILLSSLILIVVFVSLTVVLISTNTTRMRNDLTEQSKAFASLATTPIGNAYLVYQASGRQKIWEQVHALTSLDSHITNVAIMDTSGRVAYIQVAGQLPPIATDALTSVESSYIADSSGALSQVVYPFVEANGLHRYTMVYTVSSAAIDAAVQQLAWAVALLGLAGITVSSILMVAMVSRTLTLPLRAVSQQAGVISSGNLDHQIQSNRNDEIGDVAEAVNRMANSLKADIIKLKQTDEIKTEFLRLASHHLRTPLTTIRGYVSLMQERPQISNDQRDELNALANSTDRLHVVVEDMLTIAGLEVGDLPMQTEKLNFAELIAQLAEDYKTRAANQGLTLTMAEFKAGQPPEIVADRQLLVRAVSEILDNAVLFTKPGGSIQVSLLSDKSRVGVRVADTGVGIAPEELSRLFTLFHRASDTLTYDYDGVGLGLSVAKLLLQQFGGEIAITSELGRSTQADIWLPLTRNRR